MNLPIRFLNSAVVLAITSLSLFYAWRRALVGGASSLASTIENSAPMVSIPVFVDSVRSNAGKRAFLDDDTTTAVLIQGPRTAGAHSYILYDAGISHHAQPIHPDGKAPAHQSVKYEERCPVSVEIVWLPQYGQPEKVLLQLLHRQANDWDREFHIPEPVVVFEKQIRIHSDAKSKHKLTISLKDAPSPGVATSYPEDFSVILIKLQILEAQSPSPQHNRAVAIAELRYQDEACFKR